MSDVPPALAQLWSRLTSPPRAAMGAIDVADLGDGPVDQPVEPTDRSAPVRERLLAAGAALLMEEGRANLNEILSVQRLSRRAGASRQSWHNQFPDHAYLEALAAWAADPAITDQETAVFSTAIDAFTAMQPPGAAVPSGEQVIELVFTMTNGDARHRTTMLLAAIAGDDPAIAAPLRARLDRHRAAVVPTYARLFQHARFAVEAPHTVDSLSVAVNALTDGFILRRTVDPEHATAAHYAKALGAMMAGALRSIGPDGEVEPPRRGLFEAVVTTDPPTDGATITTDDIVSGTVAVFATHGTGRVTLADVARHVGCNPAVLHRRYDSIEHLVRETWTTRVVHDVRLAASGDGPPADRVRATLTTLARRCLQHYWLASARLRTRHDHAERPCPPGTAPDPGPDESGVVEALLVDAREAGRSGRTGAIGDLTDAELARLADRLTTHVIVDVVSRTARTLSPDERDRQADEIVAEVWDLLLPGLRRRRPGR